MKKPLREAQRRPNIIWFIVDQMSGHAMGCNGDPNVFTPNLDNMSICGTLFPRAVSGYPLCCPFRGSMMTGKYAHNHSVKLHEDRLEPAYRTVTDVFNDNGYETIHLGKWHLAGIKEAKGRSDQQSVPHEDRGRLPGLATTTITVSLISMSTGTMARTRSHITDCQIMRPTA